jgi:nitrogen fixation/metabolism regulation signal transduction histidine kinase
MGRSAPTTYAAAAANTWPEDVRAFWESAEPERFALAGPDGDRLDYMRRSAQGVEVFARDLAGVHMQELSTKLRQAREVVGSIEARDLRRGFTLTLLLLVAIVWLISLAPLLFLAHRISKPIRQLTAGLTDFAAGDWDRRVESSRTDEVGNAVDAFNHMAEQLRRSRERLVYLTQMSSWQSLARKTAHELKNSLTPIRLTVEEMVARQPQADRLFMQEAAQIVISEIETLERRVRAFSEFAREPPLNPEAFDLNALVTERVSLLKPAHPATNYRFKLDVRGPRVHAGADLVKGILTNLLENAADAAGPGGSILTVTRQQGDQAVVEVHDSGPGISDEASRTLFEPTITFKKHGMGLGLSIARKNALLLGGDITLVKGELGGAGFKVALPAAQDSPPSRAVALEAPGRRPVRPSAQREDGTAEREGGDRAHA